MMAIRLMTYKSNLRIKGTAMGTKIAPAYANIFIDAIRTSFLSSSLIKPSIYYR